MSVKNPETAHGLEYDSEYGTRIDGSVVKWWGTKRDAVAAARSIGWPLVSIWPVWTRFQRGYAIKQVHEGFLTRSGFTELQEDRQEATS